MHALQAGVGVAPLAIPGWAQSGDGTPLLARVLVLDNGTLRLALVSLTCLELMGGAGGIIRARVAAATGLPAAAVFVAATHLHSGPPAIGFERQARQAYVDHLASAAATAARQACDLRPARFGYGTDHLPGISRVRRIRRRDGSVITLRRACPQYWGWATDPETVGPEEPLDDRLTVVRLEDLAGQPFGAVLHFTCHPIPDFFGYAARLVESQMPGLTCLLLNGCLGTVDTPFEVPLRGRTQQAQLPILGDILGYRTLELLARLETQAEVELGRASAPVFLPLDPRFLEHPGDRAALWADAIARGGLETEVQCLRLGELLLAGIPGEPHVGYGRQIERVSPFACSRGVSNVNQSCAYLLPAASRARGGYESDPANWGLVTAQGLVRLTAALKEALECLARKPT